MSPLAPTPPVRGASRLAPRLLGSALALAVCREAPALDSRLSVTQYPLESWGRERGLPSGSVLSIAQSRDGYLWLGTYGGLVRFDGLRFVLLDRSTVPELRKGSAWRLLSDPDGTLWIGTNGGGLLSYAGGAFGRISVEEGLSHGVVTALLRGDDGSLWVGTRGGLDRVALSASGTRVTPVLTPAGVPPGDVGSIVRTRDGGVLFGTSRAIFRLETAGGSARAVPVAEIGVPVTAIVEAGDGTLWFGTAGRGLLQRAEGRETWHGVESGLPSAVVSALAADREGNLWVATDTGGLVRFRDGRSDVVTEAHGLASNSVASLLLDREGSLWVGTTRNGLSRLKAAEVLTYGPREGIPADTVWHVFEDRDGSVWVSTSGGAARLAGGVVTGVLRPPGSDPLVRAVFRDRAGTLWLATRSDGLVAVDERRGTVSGRGVSKREGLPSAQVRSLCEDAAGRLYLGTAAGLAVLESGVVRSLSGVDGLPEGPILSLLAGRDGTIWVGSDGNGLFALRAGAVGHYTTAEGLGSDVVLGLFEDESGVLWASTNGGLSRFDGRRFATLGRSAGLSADVATQVLSDGRGGLWIGGPNGVCRVESEELHAVALGKRDAVQPLPFGLPEGMRSDECNAPAPGTRTRDGRLWFPTVRGVAVFDPARRAPPVAVPPAVVEEVVARGETLPAAGTVVLGRLERTFEVRFAVLALRAPERVKVLFRLSGLDPHWTEAGLRRTAYYTSVPPGRYRFEVAAVPGGTPVAGPSASLDVVVTPAAWETWWARSLALAAAALAAAFLVRRRLRRAERHAVKLAAEVAARTRELSERNLELASERERLRDANERLRETDRLKAGVTAMLVHDLKSPLSVVGGAVELLRTPARLGEKERGELLDSARRNLDRVLRLVNETLEVFRSEAGEAPQELETVDPVPLLRSAGESARIAATPKGVEVVVDVPDGLPALVGDSGRLARVFENLLGNAVKFTAEGGRVTLSAAVEVGRGGAVPSRLVVRVGDTGEGISPEDLPYVFEPYRQAGRHRSGGVGLGLAVVRRVVEAHGGRVAVESAVGAGTTFSVELPLGPGSRREP